MSEIKKGNAKKQQVIEKLISEISLHKESFSLFSQEEAIDSFSLDQVRSDARKEGIKLIFIPNRILKVALFQKGFSDDIFDEMLKNSNFIALSQDPVKSISLINFIKDKKLKSKIQIKGTVVANNLFHKKDEIEFLIRAGSQRGIQAMFIQILRGSIMRFVRTLHAQIKKNK